MSSTHKTLRGASIGGSAGAAFDYAMVESWYVTIDGAATAREASRGSVRNATRTPWVGLQHAWRSERKRLRDGRELVPAAHLGQQRWRVSRRQLSGLLNRVSFPSATLTPHVGPRHVGRSKPSRAGHYSYDNRRHLTWQVPAPAAGCTRVARVRGRKNGVRDEGEGDSFLDFVNSSTYTPWCVCAR